MIAKLCEVINLKPIFLEPGTIPKFESNPFSLTYYLPEREIIFQKYENDRRIRNNIPLDTGDYFKKVRDKIWEDLADVSYKGCVYFSNWYTMEDKLNRRHIIQIEGYKYGQS